MGSLRQRRWCGKGLRVEYGVIGHGPLLETLTTAWHMYGRGTHLIAACVPIPAHMQHYRTCSNR
eukprot:scaffold11216_cov126-Isochrysis_galbana.AAC.5